MLARRRLSPVFVRTVPGAAMILGSGALAACDKTAVEKPTPEVVHRNPPAPTEARPADASAATPADAGAGVVAAEPPRTVPTDDAGCPLATPPADTACAKSGASCTFHVNGCTEVVRCVATDAGPRWDAHFLPCNPPPPEHVPKKR